MNNKTLLRIMIYLGMIVVMVVAVHFRSVQAVKEQKKEIVSILLEWQKNGKPVDVLKVERGVFTRVDKVSAIKNGNSNRLTAYVSPDLKKRLQVGQVVVLGSDNLEIAGSVGLVSNYADITSGLYEIQVVLNIKSSKIVNNSNSKVIPIQIITEMNKGVWTLPVEYIFKDDKQNYVWKIINNIATKTYVAVQKTSATDALISSGLNDGDLIATNGAKNLIANEKVLIHK